MLARKSKIRQLISTLYKGFIFLLNIVVIVCTIFAYNGSIFSSSQFVWFQLFSLAFPFLLIFNIVFIVYWIFARSYKFLFSLIILLIGYRFIFNTFSIPIHKKDESKKHIQVGTFNAHLFGFFEGKNHFDIVTEHIKNNKFDIVCIQEFLQKEHYDTSRKINGFLKKTSFKYFYNYANGESLFSSAIFSNYKIINNGFLNIIGVNYNHVLWCDLLIDEDTVRVYNVHLKSYNFNKKELQTSKNIDFRDEENVQKSKSIIQKMFRANKIREQQAVLVRQHISQCRYPTIVCGDFNATPLTYSYNTIAKGLKNAYEYNALGIQKTYNGTFPSFRIDHILFSKKYKAVSYNSTDLKTSDHNFISATLEY